MYLRNYRLQKSWLDKSHLETSECFRIPFDSQPVRGSQTLLKPSQQHFYHIFMTLREMELENVSVGNM